MKSVTDYKPAHPDIKNYQLDMQRERMAHIAELVIKAVEEEGNIHRYTAYRVFSTIAEVLTLKEVYLGRNPSPEVEDWLQRYIQSYLFQVEKLPKEACQIFLQVLDHVSSVPQDQGALKELRWAILSAIRG